MATKHKALDGLAQILGDAIRGEVTRRLGAAEFQQKLFEVRNDPKQFNQVWHAEINQIFDELAARYAAPSKPFVVQPRERNPQ